MSDEKNPRNANPETSHLKDYQRESSEKAITKLEAVKAAKKLSNGDSPWTLTQEMLQEVMAGHTVANPTALPPLTQMVEELKKEIEQRYKEEEETKNLLLESIPAMRSVREWVKKDGWEDAVWGRIRADGLFTSRKRAQVIESVRERALDKSDVAAKIWLTLSGDYSEKMEVNDKSVEQYREINKVLHGKKDK
jgi:ABC-type branched-subunit amino acid transport system substrate-binding protein